MTEQGQQNMPLQRAHKGSHLVRAIQFVVTVSLLTVLLTTNDIELSTYSGSTIVSHWWLATSIVLGVLVAPLLAASRWQVFLHYVDVTEHRLGLIQIFFTSSFFGVFLPSVAGADAVRMYLIERKYPMLRGRTSATVLCERLFGFVLLSIFGLLGTIVVHRYTDISYLILVMSMTVTALLVICVVLLNRRTTALLEIFTKKTSRLQSVFNYILSVSATLSSFPVLRALPHALPYMILYQASMILIVYLLFLSIGEPLSIVIHLAFFPIIAILTLVPISLAGLGVREGAFIYFYALVGISPETSLFVSISFFAISTLCNVFIGGVLALYRSVLGQSRAHQG